MTREGSKNKNTCSSHKTTDITFFSSSYEIPNSYCTALLTICNIDLTEHTIIIGSITAYFTKLKTLVS